MSLQRADIEAILQQHRAPFSDSNLTDAIERLTVDAGNVELHIQFGYPCNADCKTLEQALFSELNALDGVQHLALKVDWKVEAAPVQGELSNYSNVKNIIAVASGKGGVGKSTTSANLALALAAQGARVGILDADIYGPSMGQMFGIEDGTRPEVKNDKFFLPIIAHGVEVMSMAFLLTEETPVVWRGPMVSGALIQLITQTLWNDLDYLFIDLPPGTGDIQLTLAQQIPVSGSVVVTTPQDLALIDAKKGIEMFNKVSVPVLGVVENMSVHVCSNCGFVESIFGDGGGERIAKQFDVPLLGALPLTMSIREQADSGAPTVVAAPQSVEAGLYTHIAGQVAAKLWQRNRNTQAPTFVIEDD